MLNKFGFIRGIFFYHKCDKLKKSVQWKPCCCTRPDSQTGMNMTKAIGAFRDIWERMCLNSVFVQRTKLMTVATYCESRKAQDVRKKLQYTGVDFYGQGTKRPISYNV